VEGIDLESYRLNLEIIFIQHRRGPDRPNQPKTLESVFTNYPQTGSRRNSIAIRAPVSGVFKYAVDSKSSIKPHKGLEHIDPRGLDCAWTRTMPKILISQALFE
jgi:hypothetical protein